MRYLTSDRETTRLTCRWRHKARRGAAAGPSAVAVNPLGAPGAVIEDVVSTSVAGFPPSMSEHPALLQAATQ